MAPSGGRLSRTTRKRALLVCDRFPPEPFLVGEIADDWRSSSRRFDVLTQVPSYPFDSLYLGFKNRIIQVRNEGGIRVARVATVLGYRRSLVRKILGYLAFSVFASIQVLLHAGRYRSVYVYQTGPLTQALPAVLLHRLFGCRSVIWTQDIWPDAVFAYGLADRGLLAWFLNAFVRWIYRGFDEIHVSSPGFIPAIRRHARRGCRIRFVPQWAPRNVSNAARTARVPLQKSRQHFSYIGNLGKVQNLENVIRGFAMARRKVRTLQLNLVGTGSEAEHLQRFCSTSGIDGVRFWGQQPQEEILAWMHASKALVLSLAGQTALARTIPAKFQAYLQARRPLLVAATGDVARLVRRHDLGLAVPPDDVGLIADAFVALAELSEARASATGRRISALNARMFDRTRILALISKSVFS